MLDQPKQPTPFNMPDLERFVLFRNLPSALLNTWKPRFIRQQFHKRQPLVFPSGSPDVIFFVHSGKVKVSYYSEDGKEFTVAILSSGDVYSEHSLALATAVEDTEVFYLGMREFQRMLDESPELARRLIRVLGQILRVTNDLIFDLAFREAASRLARVMERAIQSERNFGTLSTYNTSLPSLPSYRVCFTHEDLAAMSGITRQTVNEILRRWERQGILTLQRGEVHILDLKLLCDKIDV
ncbi:RmlC-like jelly roll fold [Acididesulfobacillus acetoxydans]|uniref:RmlC-like jelly roll fold n=1 Tax=Acididesulfobacillus acetoxydans TaxID=1561005 RepID=A0A8S0WWU1_9FIRM|nr:Crp/Fnr family transcriptional regulator [Acididesulfobacillus acetoxydans]CAA7600511.1 RmlC-like jelly roll fold [Acididesulfobacillus acetoxydans]CEJ06645.1 cAMP-binding protein [Acididesulfobacillus acetoxydans]